MADDATHDAAAQDAGHRVECRLDELLVERDLTVAELARRVGVTVVNLSVLKNNRAKAIRFSTLTAMCDALSSQPGDLFTVEPRHGTILDEVKAPRAGFPRALPPPARRHRA